MCSYNYIGDCASAIITVLINGKCGEAYNTANPDVRLIVSDYNRSKDFYVNKLGFSVIRENYRPERNDWKSDLQCGNIELEIFGVSNPPARVSHPEAAKM